jgi:hypothetical protein
MEHQPAAGAEQSGRLGDPALGIAPYAGAILADHQIEAGGRERHVLGVGLDQGECQPEVLLAASRGGKLRPGEVEANRAGPLPGQLGGQVGGATAQLDHVQAGDVAEHAQVVLADTEEPPGELLGRPGPVGVLGGELRVHRRPQGAVSGDVRPGVRHDAS